MTPLEMQISAIQKKSGRGDFYEVFVDGEPCFTAPSEVIASERLSVGMPLDPARIAELQRRALAWRTRDAALNLLSYRPRTASELRGRLLRKGFAANAVDECIDELLDRRLLDDSAFAESFVRDRVRLRPRGRRRLEQELREKGVEPDVARTAISSVMADESLAEIDLARDAAARWSPRRGEDLQRARRRLFGFLARRGFSADVSRQLLDETIPHQQD